MKPQWSRNESIITRWIRRSSRPGKYGRTVIPSGQSGSSGVTSGSSSRTIRQKCRTGRKPRPASRRAARSLVLTVLAFTLTRASAGALASASAARASAQSISPAPIPRPW